MRTINADKAMKLLQDDTTPWWVKSNIKDLLSLKPAPAAELFGQLESIFEADAESPCVSPILPKSHLPTGEG